MTTTISVEGQTLERFHDLKQDLDDEQDGVPDHTADSFLWALMDTWEAADEGYYASDDTLADVSDLADQLDRIEDAAREATNAAQNAERAAEELAGQR